MKSHKVLLLAISALICLSLFSIGFASWTISNRPSPNNFSTSLIADDVLKFNEFVSYCDDSWNPSSSFDSFDFYKTGFVSTSDDGSYVVSDQGTITIRLKIASASCFNRFNNPESIAFSFQLSSSNQNLNLFNNPTDLEKNISCSTIESTIDFVEEVAPSSSRITFNLSYDDYGTSEYVYLTINYQFNILNLDYFKDTIYPILNEDNFKFRLSAILSVVQGGDN